MPAKKSSSVVEVVKLSSSITGGSCYICGVGFGDNDYFPDFERRLNHYLAHPGCKLLHIGQETERCDEGIWHSTVAVVSIPRTTARSRYTVKLNVGPAT